MAFFRMVIVALCLAGIATMLQGCGGGGSSGHGAGPPAKDCKATAASDKCMCTSFDLATGTSTTTITGEAVIDGGSIGDIPVGGSTELTLKMNVDTLNLRLDMSGTGEGGPFSGNKKQTVVVKVIMDSTKQVMVHHVTQNGQPAKCEKVVLPPAQVLKEQVDQARALSDTVLKCKGNDGTFDSWQVAAPPGTLPEGLEVDATVRSDNAHRLKSISMTGKKFPQSPSGISAKSAQIDADFTEVSDNGPTAADLDFSTWGDCKSGPGGPQIQDFLMRLSAHHPMLAVLGSVRPTAIASQTEETTPPSAEAAINI